MKYHSPKISLQNQVSFTCSDAAVEDVLSLLNFMKHLGQLGCSRAISIDGKRFSFDGDGAARVDNIHINGMSQEEWREEIRRLDEIASRSNKEPQSQDEQAP